MQQIALPEGSLVWSWAHVGWILSSCLGAKVCILLLYELPINVLSNQFNRGFDGCLTTCMVLKLLICFRMHSCIIHHSLVFGPFLLFLNAFNYSRFFFLNHTSFTWLNRDGPLLNIGVNCLEQATEEITELIFQKSFWSGCCENLMQYKGNFPLCL